jgi:WD40 repeat protein
LAQAVALCPGAAVVATQTYGGPVRLWNSTNGTELWQIEVGEHHVQGLAFTPNGERLVLIQSSTSPDAGGTIGEAILFDIRLKREVRRLTEHQFPFTALAILPQGNKVALGSRDLVLWDLATGQQDRINRNASAGTKPLASQTKLEANHRRA